jgi:hypothetical protein
MSKVFVDPCHGSAADGELTLGVCTSFGEFTSQLQNKRVLHVHLLVPAVQTLTDVLQFPNFAIIHVQHFNHHLVITTRHNQRHPLDGIHSILQSVPIT